MPTSRTSSSSRAARASRRRDPRARPPAGCGGAVKDYRVLLLDQRGTGRSTPVGDIPGDTPAAQAEYLTHFRADAIVRDAEHIRQELGVERWSLLGQSFGGFTSMTYLSIAPDGLREALITGGLAPIIGRPVDDVYGATYVRLIEKHHRYFERYPEDRAGSTTSTGASMRTTCASSAATG